MRKRQNCERGLVAVLIVAFAGLGCVDQHTPDPTEPGTSTSVPNSQAMLPGITPDDFLEELSRTVPGGFGGMHRDANGDLVVTLVDTDQGQQAVDALMRIPGIRRMASGSIKVKAGSYDFGQLRNWMRALDVAWSNGVVMMDVAEQRNVVVVGVHDASNVEAVRAIGIQRGVPAEALSVENCG